MRAFASAFARPRRKASLRKQFGALDLQHNGRLSRRWLQHAVSARDACSEAPCSLKSSTHSQIPVWILIETQMIHVHWCALLSNVP